MNQDNSDLYAESDASPSSMPAGQSKVGESTFTDSVMFNLILPLVLLTIGVGVLILFGKVEPQSRPRADKTRTGRLRALPPVRVEPLAAIDVQQTPLQLEVDGTVVPFSEALVAAEVAGEIVHRTDECQTGSFVNAGQLLMKIDSTDYQLEVERLTKLKEQEYQALSELDQEMANLKRSLEVAKQDVALQQDEVDRRMKLPEGFASQGEIDQAKRALLQATQQLVGYENQVQLLKARRVRLEASERLAATQLKKAEVDLKRCEIRAPIDGVIANDNVDLNSFVNRGTVLVTIENTSKVEVSLHLRMDQLYWVLDQVPSDRITGDSAASGYQLPETPAIIQYELTGRDGAFYQWRGRLIGYDGIGLDPTSRTVPVRVIVDNPRRYQNNVGRQIDAAGPSALVRGMYVRVKLLVKPKTPLVVIPARALKPGNRVWQFIPDESVLDAKTEEQQEASPEADTNAVADDQPEFNPDEWAPGRVVVRDSIIPVDSLFAGSSSPPESEPKAARMAASDERMWVCEVRDQTLEGGSLVVTSPLAAVDNNNMPARVNADALAPVAAGNVAVRRQSTRRGAEEK